MTKFIEALEAQIDHSMQRRAKPMKCLAEPITLIEDYCRIDIQDRYLLKLVWNVAVWLDSPVLPSSLEAARKEAMKELSALVYGEIYGDLNEAKYMIKYGDTKDAIKLIDEIMKKIGFPMRD